MHTTTDHSDRISHTLYRPINVDGAERATINIRRLRTKDLRDIEKFGGNGLEKTIHTIQRLSGWPPEAVDELDVSDIVAVGAIIEGFTRRKA